jgi:hypothetical protein
MVEPKRHELRVEMGESLCPDYPSVTREIERADQALFDDLDRTLTQALASSRRDAARSPSGQSIIVRSRQAREHFVTRCLGRRSHFIRRTRARIRRTLSRRSDRAATPSDLRLTASFGLPIYSAWS